MCILKISLNVYDFQFVREEPKSKKCSMILMWILKMSLNVYDFQFVKEEPKSKKCTKGRAEI